MTRPPAESESIYDFDYLRARRKEHVKRGQTFNVDEDGEPARPLRRPRIGQDSVKLPPVLVGNNNKPPAGGKPQSRKQEVPDWLRDNRRPAGGEQSGLGAVKPSPSDLFAAEIGYKTVEAEKKREWDKRYERMMREREELKEAAKKNSLHYKEKIAFAPVKEDRHMDRYDRNPSRAGRFRQETSIIDKSSSSVPDLAPTTRRAHNDHAGNQAQRYNLEEKRCQDHQASNRKKFEPSTGHRTELSYAEPDAEERARWDRKYEENLRQRQRRDRADTDQQNIEDSSRRRSFTNIPPTRRNDRPRDSPIPGRNAPTGDIWQKSTAPVPQPDGQHGGYKAGNGPYYPTSQTSGFASSNVPHVPAPPTSKPTNDKSYSKSKRHLLKPAVSTPPTCDSPIDAIAAMDMVLAHADTIEKLCEMHMTMNVGSSRSSGVPSSDGATFSDSDDASSDNIDDLLAIPVPSRPVATGNTHAQRYRQASAERARRGAGPQ